MLFRPILPSDGQNITEDFSINYAELLANPTDPFITTSNPLVEKLEFQHIIGQHAIVYRGIETRSNDDWLSKEAKDETYVPILLGSDVNKFTTTFTGTYLRFVKSEMKSNANEAMYRQPKILMRRTGSSIIADLDKENFFALKNLAVVQSWVILVFHSIYDS